MASAETRGSFYTAPRRGLDVRGGREWSECAKILAWDERKKMRDYCGRAEESGERDERVIETRESFAYLRHCMRH